MLMSNFRINILKAVQEVAWGCSGFPLFVIFASQLSSILFTSPLHARPLILVELITS